MKSMILGVKGFIMGIANIIPGVSGGTLALILGIYEDFIASVSHFFSDFKKNVKFLLPVLIGLGLAILSMSNVIDYSYKHFPVATTLFFIGLVLGGIPLLMGKVKGKKHENKVLDIVVMILTFSLVIFMAFAGKIFDYHNISFDNMNIISYVVLFLVGMLASATMVIPGVSGSLVLMLLGYYYPIINLIKNIFNFNNIIILGVFGIGVLVGIVLVAKLLEYLFAKHEVSTYYGVLGFIFASILAIPISTYFNVKLTFNVIEIIIGVVMLLIGYLIAYKLGEK